MKRLIECVPNFSEGRDPAKVDAIVAAMSSVPGVYVLDREMDADHNRSVVTLAGEPDAVAEAAILGAGKAMELIDLTKHSGAHPRVGATDVLPFIPIDGVTIEDCVALARRVGNEIWKRHRIPVFFYEAAATRPDRINLENVRRRHREQNRQGDPVFIGRAAVCEIDGRGIEGAQSGTSVHQPDGFRTDADAPRVRDGEARSRALRRDASGQRNRWARAEKSDRDGGGLFPTTREFLAGAGV